MSPLIQGAGIGLRSIHYKDIFSTKPDVAWFEILTDNFKKIKNINRQF